MTLLRTGCLFCMFMPYVRAAWPCQCCMPMSMLHVMFLLHVFLNRNLHIHVYAHASCPFCMSMLLVRAIVSCYMSMLHVYAACPRCRVMLHVPAPCAACPCCLSVLHVRRLSVLYFSAECTCFMSTDSCACCISMQHVIVYIFFSVNFLTF